MQLPDNILLEFNKLYSKACFPVWAVNTSLGTMADNEYGKQFFLDAAFSDIRNLLVYEDIMDSALKIEKGENFRKSIKISNYQQGELAFSPLEFDGKILGAYVFYVPSVSGNNPEKITKIKDMLEDTKQIFESQTLRRNINDIITSINFATYKLQGTDCHEVNQELSSIVSKCYNILRTSDNISRYNQKANISQEIDYWDNLAQVMEATTTLLHKEGLAFTYTLPESTVYVDCNFRNITNVIMNIISNSYLYAGAGVTVNIYGYDIGGNTMLEISDNGVGLPQDVIDNLFKLHINEDTEREHQHGAGLGLAVSYSTMCRMGGNLVYIPTKKGTTMRIIMPSVEYDYSDTVLSSSSVEYLKDRYSQIYIGLCDILNIPLT